MASFNAEVACKALEQRISGLERSIDALRKATQPDAAVAARANKSEDRLNKGEDRLAKLENVVKVLGENRNTTKVDAMEKTLKALDSAKLIDAATFNKLTQQNEEKRKTQADAQSKRQTDEIVQKTQVMVEKQIAEVQKQAATMKLEARLQVLEMQVKSLSKG